MFCSKCGKQLNVGAAFCDGCGAAVNGLSPEQTSVGVQRGGGELNERIRAERSEKIRAIAITAIISVVELIFLFIAMSSELSNLKFFFNDEKGRTFLEYMWEKQGGLTKAIGIFLMFTVVMDVIMCYIHSRRRTLSKYKKVLLFDRISFSVVAISACVLLRDFLDIAGWLMVMILIAFNLLSLKPFFKAAECENAALYLENTANGKGRFYDTLSTLHENEEKGDLWQCKTCGTFNTALQNFCKGCGKYK